MKISFFGKRSFKSLSALLGLFLFLAPTLCAAGPREMWKQQGAGYDPDLFTGSATYTVPLDVPDGRAGLTPSLSLNYSSLNQDPKSIVGYGWDLGLARIVRDQRTGVDDLYSDGNFQLELSGSYLSLEDISLSSGEYGTYGVDVEGNFYEIEFHSNDSWTVTTKEGVVMTFGSSATARIDNPDDSTQIYAWYLEEVRDLNDNYIGYSYYKDDAAVYPEEIIYTGNGTTDGPFTVRFEPFATGTPSARDDVFVSYAPGFALEYQYLVESIEVEISGETSPVLTYDFSYTTGDNGTRSLLESVTPSGLDGDDSSISLEPWEFSYSTGTDGWTDETSGFDFPEVDLGGTESAVADFNSDSFADAMILDENTGVYTKEIWTADEEGFTDESGSWTLPDFQFDSTASVVVDLNGDGYTDFIRSYNNTRSEYTVYLNDGENGFTDATSSWTVPSEIDFAWDQVKFGDANGDGIMDILIQYSCEDGYCDVSYVWEGDGVSGWTDVTAEYTFPINERMGGYNFSDVNGDGLDDWWVIYTSGSSYVTEVYLNTGVGTWEDVSSLWTIPIVGLSAVFDVNGDGYTDVYRCATAGDPSEVYLFTGSGWVQDTNYLYEACPSRSGAEIRFIDVNGDRLNDTIGVDWYGYGAGSWITNLDTHDGEVPDLLTEVTTPQGGSQTMTYSTSALQQDGSGTQLNPKLPYNVMVVSSVTVDDGLGNEFTTSYEYSGGAYFYSDQFDGRFAGFYQVTKTLDDGSKEITYFHQGEGEDGSDIGEYNDEEDKIGRVFKTEKYNASDHLLQDKVTTRDREDLGNDRAFVYPLNEGTRIYNTDSTHRDTAVEYEYDSYGNLATRIDDGEVSVADDGIITDIGTDRITTHYLYVTTTSPYLVGLLAQEQLDDYDDHPVSRIQYFYDGLSGGNASEGNLTLKKKLKGFILGIPQYIQEEFTNDAYGNITDYEDAVGNVTSYSYDASNLYPDEITNALAQVMTQTVDLATGQVVVIEDPNGFVKEWVYDTFGRVEEERMYTSSTSTATDLIHSYAYSTTSVPNSVAMTSYSDASTSTTSYEYKDGFGRTVQTRTPMETGNYSIVETAYDQWGDAWRTTQPYEGSGTSYSTPSGSASAIETTFDALGRVEETTDDVGTITYAYDDWVQSVTDEEGNEKTYASDARGNLIRVDEENDANTYTTTYTYTEMNLLSSIEDAAGNIKTIEYDPLGRVKKEDLLHDPSVARKYFAYQYDDAGNVTEVVNPRSVTITSTYDELNRLLTEDADSGAGTETTYTYDSATNGIGRLASADFMGTVTSFVYDIRGNIRQEQIRVDAVTYPGTDYAYDWLDREISRDYPTGDVQETTYNSQGMPETIVLNSNAVVDDIDYNANNQPTYFAFSNGVETTNTYDVANRYRLTDKYTSNGTDLFQDLDYTYDAVGNVTVVDENSDLETEGTFTYGYDDLSRLTSASNTTTTSSYSTYSYSYTYDEIGNITSSTPVGSMTYGSLTHPHALTSSALGTWAYNHNGDLVDDGTYEYGWNYKDQLIASVSGTTTTTYYYDYQGNRVKKKTPGSDRVVYLGDCVLDLVSGDEEIEINVLGIPVSEQKTTTSPHPRWIHAD
ncbi:MAG: SpvB/TcaC N-terminal domain-containing protein, partial [Patescibacteria group bacterium]